MASKRQQTMAKREREQTVRERRAAKLEKRAARKASAAEGGTPAELDEVAPGEDAPEAQEEPTAQDALPPRD